MTNPEHQQPTADIDVDQSIVLVVGAHPQAERFDRPHTERLRQRAIAWQDAHGKLIDPLDIILCTDLWYLNDAALMSRPTIAIGRPGLNAATAYLANRLPPSFAVEEFVHMHFDPEFVEQTACIWGRNEEATGTACDMFAERYLDAFMHSVHLLPAREE